MSRAWAQTMTGRAVTIAQPKPQEIDPLTDIPETLARIARFNGAVPGGVYSVAQHCVVGCDCVLEETADADLARLFLLHDAHEYALGDITTPQADGLAELIVEGNSSLGGDQFREAIETAKRRMDAAIFTACGVPLPTPAQIRAIKSFDLRMLAMEKRQLLASSPKPWAAAVERAEPLRMRGGLKIWSQAKAAEEYRRRLLTYCPTLRRQGANRQEG